MSYFTHVHFKKEICTFYEIIKVCNKQEKLIIHTLCVNDKTHHLQRWYLPKIIYKYTITLKF